MIAKRVALLVGVAALAGAFAPPRAPARSVAPRFAAEEDYLCDESVERVLEGRARTQRCCTRRRTASRDTGVVVVDMAALSSSTCVTVTPVPALSDNYMYLLVDEQTKLAAVVDPVDARAMASAAAAAGATIAMVLTTHGHWDHAGGNAELAASRPGLAVTAGAGDAAAACTREVWDGDEIALGASTIRVLSTPCHTQGHVCFVVDGNVFTGDAMFVSGRGNFNGGSRGRCSTPSTSSSRSPTTRSSADNAEIRAGADWAKEAGSLHGGGRGTVPTTIGAERACNPFARVDAPAIAPSLPRRRRPLAHAPRRKGKDDWGRMR
ncbi:hydroxyacylglutathione hydrolase [Aureococcus anophagefferens]|uniref:hydroxyacylglutathione hydrolase n=1 Tax=Aureococcus anophagefferens TaxID=44056 RepID=A0ABR1FKA4_AURAN